MKRRRKSSILGGKRKRRKKGGIAAAEELRAQLPKANVTPWGLREKGKKRISVPKGGRREHCPGKKRRGGGPQDLHVPQKKKGREVNLTFQKVLKERRAFHDMRGTSTEEEVGPAMAIIPQKKDQHQAEGGVPPKGGKVKPLI